MAPPVLQKSASANSGTGNGVSSIAVTIPSDATVGHTGVLVCNIGGTVGPGALSGWSLRYSGALTSGSVALGVWTKVLTSADLGSVVTVSALGGTKICDLWFGSYNGDYSQDSGAANSSTTASTSPPTPNSAINLATNSATVVGIVAGNNVVTTGASCAFTATSTWTKDAGVSTSRASASNQGIEVQSKGYTNQIGTSWTDAVVTASPSVRYMAFALEIDEVTQVSITPTAAWGVRADVGITPTSTWNVRDRSAAVKAVVGSACATTGDTSHQVITFPGSPVAGDPIGIWFTLNDSSRHIPTAPTGWTLEYGDTSPGSTVGTGMRAFLHKNYDDGVSAGTSGISDGASVTVVFDTGITGVRGIVVLDGSVHSGFGPIGTIYTRPSSLLTTTAPATGSTTNPNLVVFHDKTTSQPSCTVPGVTALINQLPGSGIAGSLYVGTYDTSAGTVDKTATYGGSAAANGVGYQIPALLKVSTTPVSITPASAWNSRALVSKTPTYTWNTSTLVSTAPSSAWSVRSGVSLSRTAAWNVRALVGAPLASSAWALHSLIGLTPAATWNVLQRVATMPTSSWGVRARVGPSLAASWNVQTLVGLITASAWRALVSVPITANSSWSLRALATLSPQVAWNALARVIITEISAWMADGKVEVSLDSEWTAQSLVDLTQTSAWRMLAHVNSSRSSTWNVLSALLITPSSAWSVAAHVSVSPNSAWDVLGSLSPLEFNAAWNELLLTGLSRDSAWGIESLSNISSVSLSQTAAWNVRALVGHSVAASWFTRALVALTRDSAWFEERTVGVSTDSAWNTSAAVLLLQTSTWRIAAEVGISQDGSWEVRSLVGLGLDSSWAAVLAALLTCSAAWNVRHGVVTTLETDWNEEVSVGIELSSSWNARVLGGGVSGFDALAVLRAGVAVPSLISTWDGVHAMLVALSHIAPSGLTLVSKPLMVAWNVEGVIALEQDSGWNAMRTVGIVVTSTFNELHTVTKTFTAAWGTRSLISDPQTSAWTVRHAVSLTLTSTWNVGVNAPVDITPGSSWNVRKLVSLLLSASWGVRAPVAKNLASAFTERSLVAKTATSAWEAMHQVSLTVSAAWNVQVPVAPVAAFSFDEGSGTTVLDQTGNGHTGTFIDPAGDGVGLKWTTPGVNGSAAMAYCDESTTVSGTYIEVDRAPDLELTDQFTIMAWTQVSDGLRGDTYRVLITKPVNGANDSIALYPAGGDPGYPAATITTTDGIFTTPRPAAQTPVLTLVHMAIRYDGANLDLLIDGEVAATTPATGSIVYDDTTPWCLIGSSSFGNEWLPGVIDDARIYNVWLDDATIEGLMPVAVPSGLSEVSLGLDVGWAVHQNVGITPSSVWNARKSVSCTTTAAWNARSLVSKTSTFAWNELTHTVNLTPTVAWNARVVVGPSATSAWGVRKTVGLTPAAAWSVKKLVGLAPGAAWAARSLTGLTPGSAWNARKVVGLTPTAAWNARKLVGLTPTSAWNVLSASLTSYSLYTTQVPTLLSDTDSATGTLGTAIISDIPGTVTAIRYYKGGTSYDGQIINVALYSATGTLLASGSRTQVSGDAVGWITVPLTVPYSLAASVTVVAAYKYIGTSHYPDTANGFATDRTNGPLHGLVNAEAGPPALHNGLYVQPSTSIAFPTQTFNHADYFVDIILQA